MTIEQPTSGNRTHPKDWRGGIEDYLRDNEITCNKITPMDIGQSCFLFRLDGLKDVEASRMGHIESEPVAMKCADSEIKANMGVGIPVRAQRMEVEVKALTSKAVANACLLEPSVQVPSVLRHTSNGFIMSWAGDTDLRTAYRSNSLKDAASVGLRLGKWLACLHTAGILEGSDGWSTKCRELELFYVPGGVEESTVRSMISDEEEVQRVLSAIRKRGSLRTLTSWDFRPMNTIVRFHDGKDTDPDLTIVDWELAHYGEPLNDLRMWVAEVIVMETQFGNRGMLSSFLSSYRRHAGSLIVHDAFICKLAITAGIIITFILAGLSAVWECTEDEVETLRAKALMLIKAGTAQDMCWFQKSCLRPLLD